MQEPEVLAVSAAARSRLTLGHFHRPRIRCGMQLSRRLVAPVESNQQGLFAVALILSVMLYSLLELSSVLPRSQAAGCSPLHTALL
jgi:hypothetical protein